MATVSDRSRTSGLQMKDEKKDDTEKENIWASVLSEVQLKGTNKLSPNQLVLVLGDRESGKTTLVAKLQGNVDPKKGSGLEYGYIDVRDEYRDDHTHLAMWVLDGDRSHSHLLRYALTEHGYSNTLVMLTVSMTTPWAMLDQLREWASILQDHIDKLPFSAEAIREYQHKYVRRWQDYVEPGDELETVQLRRTSRHVDGGDDEGIDNLLPLPEGVLTRNLGLDIVVVVTKTDYMATLEKDMDYREEHFDFIQQHLRKFCLQYGAALFYTSVKEDKNCDLLYKYLVHRIYGLVFRTPALVVEKDAVFIPAGWDNEKKINILYENLQTMKPEDDYSDVIGRPAMRIKAAPREAEVQAEDEQVFLTRLNQQLQQQQPPSSTGVTPTAINGSSGPSSMMNTSIGGSPASNTTPIRGGVQLQKPADRRTSSSIPNQMDPSKSGISGTSEGVLANFFNSLLKKSTTAAPTGLLPSGDRGAVTAVPNSDGSSAPGSPDKLNLAGRQGEVAAELDRLAQSASSRLNPPPPSVPVSTTGDNSSSEC